MSFELIKRNSQDKMEECMIAWALQSFFVWFLLKVIYEVMLQGSFLKIVLDLCEENAVNVLIMR